MKHYMEQFQSPEENTMLRSKKRNRCRLCGRRDSWIRYQKAVYCPACFESLKYCCICHEKPVEVTWKDKGYCRECYHADTNKGFRRSVVILAVIFTFAGVYHWFDENTSLPVWISLSLAAGSSIAAGILAKIMGKKWS